MNPTRSGFYIKMQRRIIYQRRAGFIIKYRGDHSLHTRWDYFHTCKAVALSTQS